MRRQSILRAMQDETDKRGQHPALQHPPSHPSPARGEGADRAPQLRSPSPLTGEGRGGGEPPHDAGENSRPLFEALLYPHRSLPAQGFLILTIGTAIIGAAYGAMFVIIGAWPIFGFIGAECLLFWWLLRTHLRGDRRAERIRLFSDRLVLQRIDPKGAVAECDFEPYWLQVVLRERGFENPALLLRSHGRSVEIGAFLGPAERRQFAAELNRVLARWRAA